MKRGDRVEQCAPWSARLTNGRKGTIVNVVRSRDKIPRVNVKWDGVKMPQIFKAEHVRLISAPKAIDAGTDEK